MGLPLGVRRPTVPMLLRQAQLLDLICVASVRTGTKQVSEPKVIQPLMATEFHCMYASDAMPSAVNPRTRSTTGFARRPGTAEEPFLGRSAQADRVMVEAKSNNTPRVHLVIVPAAAASVVRSDPGQSG
jgi:hypothetical protein